MNLARRPLRALTVSILKSAFRNPVATFGVFTILLALLFGVKYLDTAFRQQKLKLSLANESSSAASMALVQDLRSNPGLAVSEVAIPDLPHALDSGSADLTVLVPPVFGTLGGDGKAVPAAVTVSYKAGSSGANGVTAVRDSVDRVDRAIQNAKQALSVSEDVQNAGIGLIDVFLPGLLGFNVIQSGLILAAGIFGGYRTSGVLRRVQATGVAPANLVVGHALAQLLIGSLEVAVMLLVARALFQVHLDLAAMFAVCMLGFLVFLATGFAISGWVRDGQRAPAIAAAVGMPMIFIGLLPASLFTGPAGWVIALLPISMITSALHQLVQGGGWPDIWLPVVGLAAWAAVLLTAAGRVFRWDAA